MATLVIYDVAKRERIQETALGFIPSSFTRETRSFLIQYPDGSEENVSYFVAKVHSESHQGRSSNSAESFLRSRELQKIINRLEEAGYKVRQDQTALFMSQKTDKLILSKPR